MNYMKMQQIEQIGDALTVRSDSDYGDFTVISKQDVTEQVSNAELFYDTIKKYLINID